MDLLPLFHRLKAKAVEKWNPEAEPLPPPIAQAPLKAAEPLLRPPGPAIIPRWRLDRSIPSHSMRPHTASALDEPPAGEVTLLLDDVLSRVPTYALKEGLHDLDLPLKLRASELQSGLARGRPTIALSRLSAQYPQIFQAPASAAEDTEVVLPLQKILRQMEHNQLSAAAVATSAPEPPVYPAAIPAPALFRREAPELAVPASAAAPAPAEAAVLEENTVPEGNNAPSSESSVALEPAAPAEAIAPTEPPEGSITRETPAAAEPAPEAPPETSAAAAPTFRIQPGPPRVRPPSLSPPAGLVAAPELEAVAPAESEPPAAALPAEPTAVVDSAPAAEQAPEAAVAPEPATVPEPPVPEQSAVPEAKSEPEPIAPLPAPEASSALTRSPAPFALDQEPLQTIFMTEEELDLPRISELSASLPGVTGCMILAGDHLTEGGERPSGLDANTLRDLSQKLSSTVALFQEKLPAEPNFTLYGGNRALSIFARHELSLCIVHAPRGLLPGVRERLAAVADSLAESFRARHEVAPDPLLSSGDESPTDHA